MHDFSVSVFAAETIGSAIISYGETRDIVLVLDASGYNLLAGLDNTYFLVGINQKTISGIIYDNDTTLSSIGVTDVFYENKGDGTVPYDSSSIVKKIDELPAERVHKMSGTHTGILQTSEGINWVLAYDSVDQINHIWNGIVTENGEATIVKNAGYNQDIAPYQSVSFGYTMFSVTGKNY